MTKEQIIKEALSQFSAKGYEGTSIADISKALGLAKSSIYTHFKDKESLYGDVLQHCIETWYSLEREKITKNSVHLSPEERLYFIFVGTMKLTAENREMVQFWQRAKYFPPASIDIHSIVNENCNGYVTLFQSIFEEGIQQGVCKDIKSADLASTYICLLEGVQMSLFLNPDYEFKLSVIWKSFWDEVSTEGTPDPANTVKNIS